MAKSMAKNMAKSTAKSRAKDMSSVREAAVANTAGGLMFYAKPEALSWSAHANLGLNSVEQPYSFLAEAQFVPLVVADFLAASQVYPIVFKATAGGLRPVAIINALPRSPQSANDSTSQVPTYLPSYVRRYPFAAAKNSKNGDLVLVIDRAASMISENAETPFFTDGELSPVVQNALRYCALHHESEEQTVKFTNRIRELELPEHKILCQKNTSGNVDSAKDNVVAQYWTVSEDRFNNLSKEEFHDLRKQGALPLIYAHLSSHQNWIDKMQRH